MLKKTLLISSLLFASSSYATNFNENITGGTVISNFTMAVKSSCSAEVNDVNFGNKTATEISSTTGVAVQPMTIKITCDGIPKYTIKLAATHGVSNPANGTIKTAANPTILYQLTWADGIIGTQNGLVTTWGTVLSPKTVATGTSVQIPINVKPVRNGNAIITPGAANTSVSVTIALN